MPRRVMARGGEAVILDEPEPELGPGDVMVRTAYSVISPGTERSIIAATKNSVASAHEYPHPGFQWPVIRSQSVRIAGRRPRMPPEDAASLGYSLAGVVERVGDDVLDLAPGDRVACAGSQCAYHAELVVVPRNLTVAVPGGVDLADAAHVTLGSIAIEALRRTECRFGESVLIVGAGMLGLLLVQLCRYSGMDPIALDVDPARLQLARELGAVAVLQGAGPAALETVRSSTGGFGADAAIIAVGERDSALLNFGFEALRRGGRAVGLGDFGMDIDRRRFFGAQAVFVPSIAYGPGRYDPVYEENNIDLPINLARWTENRNLALFLRLVADGRVDLKAFPKVESEFTAAPSVYEQLQGRGSPMTGILRYPAAAGL